MNRHSQADAYSQASDWLMGAARRNPEALLLLAAGCVLLMRGGERPSRAAARDRFDDRHQPDARFHDGSSRQQSGMREGAAHLATTVADYASDVKERVTETAGSYAGAVSELAADTGRRVSEQSARFGRQAQSTLQAGMDRMLRDQPLAVAALGFVAGSVVAAAFPPTEVERRTLGGAHEALTDAAANAREAMKEAAGKAAEHLRSAAEERGLTAQGLKGLAGEVAEKFTSTVTGEARDQRDGTPGSSREKPSGTRSEPSGFDRTEPFVPASQDNTRRGAR